MENNCFNNLKLKRLLKLIKYGVKIEIGIKFLLFILCKKYLNAASEKWKFTQRQVQIPNTVFVIPVDFRK